ncbi:MAG: DUF2004 domain-containing protein [Janthinobacterium lividum]
MSVYSSTYFGALNLAALADYYSAETVLHGRPVKLDINFGATATSEAASLATIDAFLANLPAEEARLRQAIGQDFAAGGEAKYYAEVLLNEILSAAAIEQLLGKTTGLLRSADPGTQLLAQLYVTRVGFYLEENNPTFVVVDYTIGPELTDELLVVNLGPDLQIRWITVES